MVNCSGHEVTSGWWNGHTAVDIKLREKYLLILSIHSPITCNGGMNHPQTSEFILAAQVYSQLFSSEPLAWMNIVLYMVSCDTRIRTSLRNDEGNSPAICSGDQ